MNKDTLQNEVKDLIYKIYSQYNNDENTVLISDIELLYKKTVVLDYLNNLIGSEQLAVGNYPNIEQEIHIVTELKEEIVITTETSIVEPETENTVDNLQFAIHDSTKATPKISNPDIILNQEVIRNPKSEIQNLPSLTIGINDKFQFIAELFKNNTEKYESAIKQLNGFDTLDSSLLFIDELNQENNWPENSNASARLITSVKNRFSQL